MSLIKYDAFCEHCQKDTLHIFFSNDHERDSSGDYQTCLECMWVCRQWPVYEPPLDLSDLD